jgi:undecaprenyl-diphosphatase
MWEVLKAVLLGFVQGVTEFLPISSSAHLLALEQVLDFHLEGIAFDVSLHLATLLAVIIYFRRDLLRLLMPDRLWVVGPRIVLATIPIGVAGFLLASFREDISPWFAVGGWTFSAGYLLLTRGRGGTLTYDRLSLGKAMGIGTAQALSIFPGVSRSGSTIAGGLWLGLAREEAARFSFLLAIPAMLGAGLHEGLKLAKNPDVPENFWALCASGVPVALLVGLVAIHVLLKAVRGSIFHRFGWYNLGAATLFGVYLALAG